MPAGIQMYVSARGKGREIEINELRGKTETELKRWERSIYILFKFVLCNA
jgi:hypothetical protein